MTRLENIPAATMLEEGIHLLQGAPRGFRVHEYDERDAEDVEAEEEEEGAVADGLEEERGDHGDDAVADRPADYRPCSPLGANVEGEDFGGVEPGGCEPGGAEGGGVEEGEGCDAGAEGALVRAFDLGVFVEDAGDEEFEGHAYGSPYHGRFHHRGISLGDLAPLW